MRDTEGAIEADRESVRVSAPSNINTQISSASVDVISKQAGSDARSLVASVDAVSKQACVTCHASLGASVDAVSKPAHVTCDASSLCSTVVVGTQSARTDAVSLANTQWPVSGGLPSHSPSSHRHSCAHTHMCSRACGCACVRMRAHARPRHAQCLCGCVCVCVCVCARARAVRLDGCRCTHRGRTARAGEHSPLRT